MKKNYFFVLLLCCSARIFSQTDTNSVVSPPQVENSKIDTSKEEIYTIVESMPLFPGGEDDMKKFILQNITYPQKEKEEGISGTCYLSFIIEKDGNISGLKVLKGIVNGSGCDKEAMRIVSIMPKWIPGKQNGKVVCTQFNLPIKFTIKTAPTPEEQQKTNASNIHYNKGVECAKANKFEDALNEFNEVLKIYPNDAEALYNKGYMYYKLNKNDEACAIWIELKKQGNSIANNMLNKTCTHIGLQADSTKEGIYTMVEKMPYFPGGERAMMDFIQNNLNFPPGLDGKSQKCYITFVVDTDGSLTNIRVLSGIPNHPKCDAAAIRVVNKMPKWIPGTQNGIKVKVQYNLVFRFII